MSVNLTKFLLVSHFKLGEDIIKQYTICYGCKPNSRLPEDVITVNGEVIFHKKGWNTYVFTFLQNYCGFKCVGFDRENGHYLYTTSKEFQELETPNLTAPQYWRREMFLSPPLSSGCD